MASGSKKINNVKKFTDRRRNGRRKKWSEKFTWVCVRKWDFSRKSGYTVKVLLGEVSVTSQLSMGSIYICIIKLHSETPLPFKRCFVDYKLILLFLFSVQWRFYYVNKIMLFLLIIMLTSFSSIKVSSILGWNV